MKLIIIAVIISLLSMAECDPCEPSHFETNSGCKKCFCSGVTDQCYAGSFYTGQLAVDLNTVEAFISRTGYGVRVLTDMKGSDLEVEFVFDGHPDKLFFWEFPFPTNFYEKRARAYGGKLNLAIRTEVFPEERFRNRNIRVDLISPLVGIYVIQRPFGSYGNYSLYSIPIIESRWRSLQAGNQLALRSDMMRTLISSTVIRVRLFQPKMKATYMKNISLDVAVEDDSLDSSRMDSIEICECPEGNSGESCQLCSNGDYRLFDNRGKNVFGECI